MKPCPFCGSGTYKVYPTFNRPSSLDPQVPEKFWYVGCTECSARGPAFSDGEDAPDTAERGWNNRVLV